MMAMGGTETGIGASGAGGYLRLYSAGVNRVTVQSNAQTLSVFGEDTVGSNYIQFLNSAGTAQGYIGMGAGAANDFIINCESSSVPMRFFNGGSERMRIESGGNVGIGITNPSSKLVIKGDGTYNSTFQRAGATVEIISDELTNNIWSPVFNITNVRQSLTTGKDSFGGIGFSSIDDSNNAGVFDAARIALINESPGAVVTPTALAFYTNTPTTQTTPAAEKMRITSNGGLKLGMAVWSGAPSSTIYGLKFETSATGKSYWRSYVNAATSHYHYEFGNTNGMVGNITSSGTATGYNSVSDYRLKENVVPMTSALDRVSQLKPSRFNFLSDADKTVDGFLAHEVQEIVPEAITGEKDAVDDEGNPEYQGIDQSKLVPLLVKSIQELEARIKILENK